MNAAETVYDEIDASKKGDYEMDENKSYGKIIVPKPGKVVCDDGKNHLHKVVLSLLLLALLLVGVSACVALGLETAKLKSETNSFSRQLGEDRSEFPNQIQQLNSSIQLFSQQLRSEFHNQIQQLNISVANEFVEAFRGQSMLNPAGSCAALPPSSPSGYYWVRASNGSAVRVYRDMTRSCGGVTGGWVRVAELDMTNDHQCPSGLRQLNITRRTCAKIGDQSGCSSPDNFIINYNIQYSMICGRITAYQFSSPDAFHNNTINSVYVDGVSLTHGNSRQHIRTFASATDEIEVDECPCLDGDLRTGDPLPSFVGNDYFCDTGSSDNDAVRFYGDNPLWDGAGCGPQSTCCSFNNPPWFYKQLQRPTTDGNEMRVCRDEDATNEDIAIEAVDIYIQ